MRVAVRRPTAAAQLFCLFFLFFFKYFFAFLSFLLCVCVISISYAWLDFIGRLPLFSPSVLFFCRGSHRTNGVDNKTHSSSGSGGIYYKRPEAGYVVGFFSFFTGRYSFLHWLVVFGFGFFWGVSLCRWLFFPQICLSAQLSAWRGFKRKVIWNHRPSTSSWLGRSRLADAQSSPSRPLLTSFSSSSSSRIGKRRRRKAIKCPFENVSLLSSSLLLLKRQASSGRKIQQLSRELYYTRL